MGGMFGGGGGSTMSMSEPRLGALRVQQSSYGLVIPIIYGRARVPGNLLWYGDFNAIAHTTRTESGGGGKGGGGGGMSQENTTYTYEAALIIALGEGVISGVQRTWRGKETIDGSDITARTLAASESGIVPASLKVTVTHASQWTATTAVLRLKNSEWITLIPGTDYTVTSGVYTFVSQHANAEIRLNYSYTEPAYFMSSLAKLGLALATGTPAQPTWGHLQTYHPAQALGYSQTAYIYGANYALTDNAEVHNHTFEVDAQLQFGGGIVDACPRDVVADFLTNPRYGAGFPSAKLGDLTLYADYCIASGLFISPAFSEQRQAQEHLKDLMTLSNSAALWSEGKLKIIPYGDDAITGNGRTYTPNLAPVYDLTDDDFLVNGDEDPVKIERKTSADAFNQVQVEFLNRANQYNVEPAEAKDQANIEQFGLRPQEPVKLHAICDVAVARNVAQLKLQRTLYIRNQYEFQLGWKYALLEPMDLVTLTDTGLGLNRTPVRITEIEEDEDGGLTVRAEDFPQGVASATRYPSQSATGYGHNYNAAPGNVLAPVFFEPPFNASHQTLRVRIAATGNSDLWGGAQVYASLDGNTYKLMTTIYGGARYGTLAAATGDQPTDTLAVQLVGKGGQMLSGTAQDAELMTTACWVDGEYIGYATATLAATGRYNLTGLNRGGYGTLAAAHQAGAPFVRIDDTIAESEPLDVSLVGQMIWFKFCSFNVYGGGEQSIADVNAYSYVLQGTALTGALPNVANLTSFFRGGSLMLGWGLVDDPRQLDYEIRKGESWKTAQTIGRVSAREFVVTGDGTYWVSARSEHAYSATPARIAIEGAGALVRNVVLAVDEDATGWQGTVTGGAVKTAEGIALAGDTLFSAVPLVSALPSMVFNGNAQPTGCYTIPPEHEVDITTALPCFVQVAYGVRLDNPFEPFSTVPLVSALTAVIGDYAGGGDVCIEIATAGNDGIYGDWRPFYPGEYIARKLKFRALLSSNRPRVTPVLTSLDITVDVPDRLEQGTSVNCPADGITTSYTRPFLSKPNVQITILNALPGDDAVLTGDSENGFNLRILNNGEPVARRVNWLAQGY